MVGYKLGKTFLHCLGVNYRLRDWVVGYSQLLRFCILLRELARRGLMRKTLERPKGNKLAHEISIDFGRAFGGLANTRSRMLLRLGFVPLCVVFTGSGARLELALGCSAKEARPARTCVPAATAR